MFLASAMAFGLLAGCSLPPPKPGSSHRDVPANSRDLTVGFGSLGPAKVGMSESEALSTGLFEREEFDAAKGCAATALKPKKQFENIEVRTDRSGTIRSFRITGPGPKTLYGIEVGTHLADVIESYAAAMRGPAEVGSERSGAFVGKNGAWIGFLFAEPPAKLDVEDTVALIEVTKGSRPQLNTNC